MCQVLGMLGMYLEHISSEKLVLLVCKNVINAFEVCTELV